MQTFQFHRCTHINRPSVCFLDGQKSVCNLEVLLLCYRQLQSHFTDTSPQGVPSEIRKMCNSCDESRECQLQSVCLSKLLFGKFYFFSINLKVLLRLIALPMDDAVITYCLLVYLVFLNGFDTATLSIYLPHGT